MDDPRDFIARQVKTLCKRLEEYSTSCGGLPNVLSVVHRPDADDPKDDYDPDKPLIGVSGLNRKNSYELVNSTKVAATARPSSRPTAARGASS